MSSQCPTCGSFVGCLSQVGKPFVAPHGFSELAARIRELEASERMFETTAHALTKRCDQLQQQVHKLEAALRKIANQEPAATANWCAEVARDVLAEPIVRSPSPPHISDEIRQALRMTEVGRCSCGASYYRTEDIGKQCEIQYCRGTVRATSDGEANG